MAFMFLDLQGESIPKSQVLGYGGPEVVPVRDGVAIKTPFRNSRSSDACIQGNLKVLRLEQAVFCRLDSSQDNQCPGVVPCLGFTKDMIQLAYMKNGKLRSYLESHALSCTLQLSWFQQMAHTLTHIHERRVLVSDIATRNFLLDTDTSRKLCDFFEASLLPLQTHMETADDDGYTVAEDIGLLGIVTYETVTGTKCEIDLYKDSDPRVAENTGPNGVTCPASLSKTAERADSGTHAACGRHRRQLMSSLLSPDSSPPAPSLALFGAASTTPAQSGMKCRCGCPRRYKVIIKRPRMEWEGELKQGVGTS